MLPPVGMGSISPQIYQADNNPAENINNLLNEAKEAFNSTAAELSAAATTSSSEMTQLIQDGARTLNRKEVGKKTEDSDHAHAQLAKNEEGKNKQKVSETNNMQLAMSMMGEIEKKSRKKSKLETTLEELAALEGLISMEDLDEEERAELEAFFENMGKVKRQKGKLRQLEDQEENYERLLKEKEEKEEKEKQKKQQQSQQQQQQPEE